MIERQPDAVPRLSTLEQSALDTVKEGGAHRRQLRWRFRNACNFGFVLIVAPGKAQQPRIAEIHSIVEHYVQTLGPRVNCVREVACTTDSGNSVVREQLAHRRVNEVARYQDAILDLHVIVVGRERQTVARASRQASAEVDRWFGLELGRAEELGAFASDGESADFKGRIDSTDVDEIGGDR